MTGQSTDRPAGPLVSGAIFSAWAEWADSTRFETTALFLRAMPQLRWTLPEGHSRHVLGVRQPPVVSGHVRGKQFSTHRPGYNVEQVHAFLNQAAPRLAAARESRAAAGRWRIKITIVYESMFGNTHKVAQAISDGVREAHPDAHVECVAVGRASPELIKSTDLLIVGGPTHLRHMTTNFSRKRQISREKKARSQRRAPARART